MSRDLYRNILRGLPDSPQMLFESVVKDMSPMSSLAHTLLGASLTHTPRKRLSLSSSISDTPKSFNEFNTSSFNLSSQDAMVSFEGSPLRNSCVKSPRGSSFRVSPRNKENLPTPYYSPSHSHPRLGTKSPLKELQNTAHRTLSFSPLKKPISPARRQHLSPVKKVISGEECDSNSRDSGYSESDQKRNISVESDQKKDCFSIPRSCAPTRRLNLDMSPKNPSSEGRKIRSFASLTSSCDEDAFLMELIGGDDEMEVDDKDTPNSSSFSSLLSAPIQINSATSLTLQSVNISSTFRSFVAAPAVGPTPTPPTSQPRLPIRRCLSMVDTTPLTAASTPLSSRLRIGLNYNKEPKSLLTDDTPKSSAITCSFKRPQPPTDSPCHVEAKRRRSEIVNNSPLSSKENVGKKEGAPPSILSKGTLTLRQHSSPESSNSELVGVPRIQRSQSESHVSIMKALNKLSNRSGEVTGDFSREHSLPLIPGGGKHPDLKSISVDTMAELIKGIYKEKVGSFKIVDCRYPYEYEGGHIIDACNWPLPSMAQDHLEACKAPPKIPSEDSLRDILIFHCEFSAERGPRAQRLLREFDRKANKEYYPALQYPELYLLEGGYKAFYEAYPELCDPSNYTRMLDEKHSDDLKFFRCKSKSWASENKQNKGRTGLARTGPKRLGL